MPFDDDRSPAPAVNRAVAVLRFLAASDGPVGVSDLARQLGLPKSSLSNILIALESTRLVERTNDGFLLGHGLVELAGAYLSRTDVVTAFYEQTAQLVHGSDETMLLGALDGCDVVYLGRHDGTQPIRLASDIGKRLPAVATALGQAMLASLEPDELDAVLATVPEYPVFTVNSYRDEASLRAALDRTRARGYAIDDELNTAGVVCFSIALPRQVGARPHAVSVTLLKARLSPELQASLVGDLADLSSSIPARLGRPTAHR